MALLFLKYQITGIACIAVGVILNVNDDIKYVDDLAVLAYGSSILSTVSTVLIVFGSVVFLVCTLCCVGIVKGKGHDHIKVGLSELTTAIIHASYNG